MSSATEVTGAGDPAGRAPAVRAMEPVAKRVEAVVRISIAADVARLVSSDPVARLGEDVEGVHQARVASRRLRSHLATYADVLRKGPTSRLSRELRWLGRSLGSVRDLDVLRDRLARSVRAIDPLARADGLALLRLADEEREGAAEGLEAVLTSARYTALLERLARLVTSPPLTPRAADPATPFFHEVVGARYAAVRDAIDALPLAPADTELHAVRIIAKRARYAAEAATRVLPPPCGRFAKRVTELCDVLGDLNDGVRMSQWLDTAATAEPGRVATVARVRTIEIGRMADARAGWPATWEDVRAAAAELGWEPPPDATPSV